MGGRDVEEKEESEASGATANALSGTTESGASGTTAVPRT